MAQNFPPIVSDLYGDLADGLEGKHSAARY